MFAALRRISSQVAKQKNLVILSALNRSYQTPPLLTTHVRQFHTSFIHFNEKIVEETSKTPDYFSLPPGDKLLELRISALYEKQKLMEPDVKNKVLPPLEYRELVLELGELLLTNHKFKEAEKFFAQILEWQIKQVGKQHISLIPLRGKLALCHFYKQQFENALGEVFQIDEIVDNALRSGIEVNIDEQALDELITFLTYVSNYLGEIPLAKEEIAQLSLDKVVKDVYDLPTIAHPDDMQAHLKAVLLKKSVAIGGKLKTEQVPEDQKKNLLKLRTELHRRLAGLYFDERDFLESTVNYQKAIDLAKEAYGEQSPQTAELYADFARVLHLTGEIDKSYEVAKKSVIIFSKIDKQYFDMHPETESQLAKALLTLGYAFRAKEQFKKGIEYVKAARKIFERVDGRDSEDWLNSNYTLVEMYDATELYDKSKEILDNVKQVLTELDAQPELTIHRLHTGLHYVRAGKTEEAMNELNACINEINEVYPPDEYINEREAAKLQILGIKLGQGKLDEVEQGIKEMKAFAIKHNAVDDELYNRLLEIEMYVQEEKNPKQREEREKLLSEMQKGLDDTLNKAEEERLKNLGTKEHAERLLNDVLNAPPEQIAELLKDFTDVQKFEDIAKKTNVPMNEIEKVRDLMLEMFDKLPEEKQEQVMQKMAKGVESNPELQKALQNIKMDLENLSKEDVDNIIKGAASEIKENVTEEDIAQFQQTDKESEKQSSESTSQKKKSKSSKKKKLKK